MRERAIALFCPPKHSERTVGVSCRFVLCLLHCGFVEWSQLLYTPAERRQSYLNLKYFLRDNVRFILLLACRLGSSLDFAVRVMAW